MRKLKIVSLVVFAVALAVSLSGCTQIMDFWNQLTDPAYALRNRWVLDHVKMADSGQNTESYYEFIVSSDNTYEIDNNKHTAVEQGSMTHVTGSSYDSTITVQTLYPELVGTTNYAEWNVSSDGELTISFYQDATKATKWTTFYCTKQ